MQLSNRWGEDYGGDVRDKDLFLQRRGDFEEKHPDSDKPNILPILIFIPVILGAIFLNNFFSEKNWSSNTSDNGDQMPISDEYQGLFRAGVGGGPEESTSSASPSAEQKNILFEENSIIHEL